MSAATTTTTTTAAANSAVHVGSGHYELVVDAKERKVINALNAFRPRYLASLKAKKEAPGAPQLFTRFSEVVLGGGSAEVRRPDGSVAHVFSFETLSTLERELEAAEAAALALLALRPMHGDDDAFEQHNFKVEVLPVGDVLMRDTATGKTQWVHERKTAEDLAASVALRKKSQGDRLTTLRDEGTRVEMIYEIQRAKRGFLDPSENGIAFSGTRMPAATLRGSVRNAEVRDGFVATFTEDADETARHLVDRFNRVARFDGGGDKTQHRTTSEQQLDITKHKKARKDNQTPESRFADALRAIPNVEGGRALPIAQHFGTMGALCTKVMAIGGGASPETLPYGAVKKALTALFADVSGVGAKTAYALFAFFHGLAAIEPPKPVPRPRKATGGASAAAQPPPKRRKVAAAGRTPLEPIEVEEVEEAEEAEEIYDDEAPPGLDI